jgi:hypothetical protein
MHLGDAMLAQRYVTIVKGSTRSAHTRENCRWDHYIIILVTLRTLCQLDVLFIAYLGSRLICVCLIMSSAETGMPSARPCTARLSYYHSDFHEILNRCTLIGLGIFFPDRAYCTSVPSLLVIGEETHFPNRCVAHKFAFDIS